MGELDVDDGLSGIVASAKMSMTFFSDVFKYVVYAGGESVVNDVSSGESMAVWRFARRELGRPLGDSGG
jgi:hypothetical protein